jgi:hypothetical protein
MNTMDITTNPYLDKASLAQLAKDDRLAQVLVRCACCRFICAAQDAARLIGYVDADETDYVRDVQRVAR